MCQKCVDKTMGMILFDDDYDGGETNEFNYASSLNTDRNTLLLSRLINQQEQESENNNDDDDDDAEDRDGDVGNDDNGINKQKSETDEQKLDRTMINNSERNNGVDDNKDDDDDGQINNRKLLLLDESINFATKLIEPELDMIVIKEEACTSNNEIDVEKNSVEILKSDCIFSGNADDNIIVDKLKIINLNEGGDATDKDKDVDNGDENNDKDDGDMTKKREEIKTVDEEEKLEELKLKQKNDEELKKQQQEKKNDIETPLNINCDQTCIPLVLTDDSKVIIEKQKEEELKETKKEEPKIDGKESIDYPEDLNPFGDDDDDEKDDKIMIKPTTSDRGGNLKPKPK